MMWENEREREGESKSEIERGGIREGRKRGIIKREGRKIRGREK